MFLVNKIKVLLIITATMIVHGLALAASTIDLQAFDKLSKEDKIYLVQKIRLLTTLMENQSHKTGPRYSWMGISPDQQDKIVELWTKIMANAYAVDSSYQNIPSNKRCIYGGWVSMTFKGKCLHPDRVEQVMGSKYKAVSQAYKQAYSNAQNTCKSGENKIACNPALYGSMVYCAPAGVHLRSVNTSLSCWKKADEMSKSNPAFMEQILDKLSADSLARAQFEELLDIIFNLCLCNGGYDQKVLDPAYAARIFYHRTCFALINQSKHMIQKLNAKLMCQYDDESGPIGKLISKLEKYEKLIDEDINERLLSNSDNFAKFMQMADEDMANSYDSEIERNYRVAREQQFQQDFPDYCKNIDDYTPTPPTPTGTSTGNGTTGDDDPDPTPTGTSTGNGTTGDDDPTPTPTGTSTGNGTGNDDPDPPVPVPTGITLEKETTDEGTKVTIVVTVKNNNTKVDPLPAGWKLEWFILDTTTNEQKSVSTGVQYTVTKITVKQTLTIKLTVDGEEKGTLNEEIPAIGDDSTDISISISDTTVNAKTIELTAIVKNGDGKELTEAQLGDFEIIWYAQKVTEAQPPKDDDIVENEEDTPDDNKTDDDEVDDNGDNPEDTDDNSNDVTVGDYEKTDQSGLYVIFDRKTVEYSVKAELVIKSSQEVKGEVSSPIQKLDESDAPDEQEEDDELDVDLPTIKKGGSGKPRLKQLIQAPPLPVPPKMLIRGRDYHTGRWGW